MNWQHFGLNTALGAGVLALISMSGPASAEMGGRIPDSGHLRSLTPWILDVQRAEEGIPVQQNWNDPNAPDWAEVALLADNRPTLSGPEIVVETEHAMIHYTLEGDDAVEVDKVAIAADAIEYSWNHEINVMGYPTPLTDNGRGGNDKYDFYFTKQFMTYGYTSGEPAVDDNSRPSFIALATWMGEYEIQVTVPHEFFHSIHMTLDYKEDTWWLEATATWMEDQVYDDINDYYNYIPMAFSSPETPIDDNGQIVYAHAIYVHSIAEQLNDVDVVQDIWFATSQSATPEALYYNKQVIESRGRDWPTTIHYFRESMLDLDRFSEGDAYAEEVGEVDMSGTFEDYPASVQGTLDHTGAHMAELLPPPGYGTLVVDYPGAPSIIASLFVEVAPNDFEEYITDTSVGGGKSFVVPNFGSDYDRVVMVFTQVAIEGTTTYDFTIDVTDWTDEEDPGPTCSISKTGRTSSSASMLGGFLLLGLGLVSTRRRRA